MGNHTSTPTISCHFEDKALTNKKNADCLYPCETETIRGTIRLNVPKEDLRESFEGISIDVAGVEYVVMPSPPIATTTTTATEASTPTTTPQYQQQQQLLAPTNAVVRLKASIADFGAVDADAAADADDRDHRIYNCNSKNSSEYFSYPFEIKLPTNNDSYKAHEQAVAVKKGFPSLSSSRSVSSSSFESSSSSSVPPGVLLRHNDDDSFDYSDDEIDIDNDKVKVAPLSSSTIPRRKTVIAYRLKAFLRRKPGVRLTIDTDIKCYAE